MDILNVTEQIINVNANEDVIDINVVEEVININVDDAVINILSQPGAYPLPSTLFSVFGRVGNVVAQEGDYNLTQLSGVTISSPSNGQILSYNGSQWVNVTPLTGGSVTSVDMSVPVGLQVSGNPITTSGTLAVSLASGYVIPTQAALDAKQDDLNGTGIVKSTAGTISYLTDNTANWDAAYNDKINSASVTGTTIKTLTLNQQDGGTITASWTDDNTDAVSSVFGRTGAVVAANGDYTTSQVTEGSNLYFTNARVHSAISGTAPISEVSGVISIAQSNTTTDGYLSATDWNTFNNKQPLITAGTTGQYYRGDKTFQTLDTLAVPENTNLYYTEARVNANTNVAANTAARHNAVTLGTANGLSLSTQILSLAAASTSTTGALTSTDWNTFNNKQPLITAGTTAQYYRGDKTFQTLDTLAVAENTNLYYTDARARAAISGTLPISVTSGVVSISQAGGASNGYLSSTDWNTFNNKQAALNGTGFVKSTAGVISYDTNTYLTTISGISAGGELSGTYANPSLVNSAVTGKVLTGLNLIGGGTIAATDSILGAFGKVQNQISALFGGVMYEGTWNASTNTPTIVSSVGSKGDYYIVATAGNTNINGITSWNVGDWIIFNGSTWDKVDNTDAVSSVNGYTGAVNLVTSDIAESGNSYFTNARAIGSTLTGYTSGAGVVAATDTILQAIQKLNGNIGGLVTGVSSVFGRTGAVVAASGDYTTTQVTEGTNLYYTEARVNANANVAANTAARHNAVTIGTANGLSLSTQALSLAAANTTTTGALTSTDWNTFNNKLSTATAASTYVPYTGATGDVTLGSHTLSAAQIKSTSSAGLSINANSGTQVADFGAGGGANITFFGGLNGTSASFSSSVTGSNLSGTNTGDVTIGTANGLSLSLQALSLALASTSATGALSSTDWNTFNGKQAALNGTGFVKISGTTISYDNSTYLTTSAASSTYLPLAGGTLTGALNGTTATFSGNVRKTGSGSIYTELQSDGIYSNATDLYLLAPSTKSVFIYAGNAQALSIASSGAATFSSSVSANGVMSLGNDGTYGSTYKTLGLTGNSNGSHRIFGGTADDLYIAAATGRGIQFWTNGNVGGGFTIASGGAASFSSSVTATAGIFNLNTTDGGFKIVGVNATPTTLSYLANNYFPKFYTRNHNYGITIFDQSEATAIQSADLVNGNNARSLILNPYGGNVLIGTSTLGTSTAISDLLTIGKTGSSSTAINFTDGTATRWGFIYANSAKMVYGSFADVAFESGASATERMRITSGGNLGLAVTPSAWNSTLRVLEIGGPENAYIAFNPSNLQSYIYWNAYYDTDNRYKKSSQNAAAFGFTASGSYAWFNAPSGTAGNAISFTQAMTLDASGRLGVGTTSLNNLITFTQTIGGSPANLSELEPYATLKIKGRPDRNNIVYVGAIDATTGMLIQSGTTSTAANLALNPFGGNVGIGTSSPVARLDAYYLSAATANLGDNIVLGVGTDGGVIGTYTQIGLGYHSRNSGQYFPAIIASVVENSSNQNAEGIAFATRSATTGTTRPSERMRITSAGDLGINTTSPVYKLEVNNSTADDHIAAVGTTPSIQLMNANTGAAYWGTMGMATTNNNFITGAIAGDLAITNRGSVANNILFGFGTSEKMRIVSDGSVLINTTSNGLSAKLNVNGLGAFGSVYVGSLGTGLVYSSSGTLTSTNPSDERLKDNITDISWGLNDILKLRPVSYHWKDDKINQGVQFGFIAQEVQEVMPEAIKEFGKDVKYLGLEKDAIYATLVKAIQELKVEIEELKLKIK